MADDKLENIKCFTEEERCRAQCNEMCLVWLYDQYIDLIKLITEVHTILENSHLNGCDEKEKILNMLKDALK